MITALDGGIEFIEVVLKMDNELLKKDFLVVVYVDCDTL